MFEWDEKQRKSNLKKHRIDFDSVWDFDWKNVINQPDLRANYGEERFVLLGIINGRLHSLAYTWRGNSMRLISLRKASEKEKELYEEKTEAFDN